MSLNFEKKPINNQNNDDNLFTDNFHFIITNFKAINLKK